MNYYLVGMLEPIKTGNFYTGSKDRIFYRRDIIKNIKGKLYSNNIINIYDNYDDAFANQRTYKKTGAGVGHIFNPNDFKISPIITISTKNLSSNSLFTHHCRRLYKAVYKSCKAALRQ